MKPQPQGYSLHIGVNAVDPNNYEGWDGRLDACENDAAVYKAIAEKAGYSSVNSLLTEKATSTNVLSHLKKAAGKLRSGDILLLTYSGHGGALIDSNNDEPDKQDETWCLYDRQLIDDELHDAFSKFKAGVRILVFSDSCHSGTVSRAPLEVDTTSNRKSRLAPIRSLVLTYNKHKQMYDDIQSQISTSPADIKAYVVQFGACQDSEEAMEADGNGLFTAKVKKVMKRPAPNYTSFLGAIRKDFDSGQHPNLHHYGNQAYNFLSQAPFVIHH
ncbi:MAG TPA: caspase family protein [Chitinophaga sp.]|nr:caspase family protein [Chitinophaga sp.]